MGVSFSKKSVGVVKKDAQSGSAYDAHMGSHQILGSTSVVKKSGQVEKQVVATNEVVHPGVMVPDSKLFKLTVEGGQTLNLGNYESAKISISVTVPTTKEELDEAYMFATDWVNGKITAAIASVKG